VTTAPPRPPADPDSEGGALGVPPTAAVPTTRASYRLRYVVVGAVLVGALIFLVVKGLGSALNFYLPADQAVQQEATLGGKTFNLEGVVASGSVHGTSNGVDFVVTSGSTRVEVDNTGSPPQLFQVGIPVIAVGHFSAGTFVSDQILVKHSASYIAAHPGRVTAPNGSRR
jgi:cytochrome c-type biogenesis protein CcmE